RRQILLLTSTSDVIRIITGSAAAGDCHAAWMGNASGTITPGRTNTASISTATTTTVVASPGASTQRNVKNLTVHNTHATVSTTVTIEHFDGTNAETLWDGTLLAGESVIQDEIGVWTAYTSGGIPKTTTFVGPADVQIFTATGANTWTKPTSFTPKVVIVKLWAAGGGGGAGASLATAVIAKGGGGGGGGGFARESYNAADLGATVTVTIGAGGAAGTPGAAGAAGGNGGVGGNSTFGTSLTVFGGGGGAGGAISGVAPGGGGGGGSGGAGGVGSTTGGTGGLPTAATNGSGGQGVTGAAATGTSANAEFGGAGGAGINATPTGGAVGGSSLFAGGGGGAGGSHNATPAIV